MNEVRLINYLNKKGRTTASELAEKLNVSKRTIINYVKRINDALGVEVINSSNKGYLLKEGVYGELMDSYSDGVPNNFEDRKNYIVHLFLTSSKPILQDYMLEELNISETSLYNLMKDVSDYFKQNNLEVIKEKNEYYLLGLEVNKRSTIRKIFSEETHDHISYFFKKQDILSDHEIEKLREIVQIKIDSYGINMNEFALSNVLLHLIIAVNRLKENQYIEESVIVHENKDKEYELASEIFVEIANTFNVNSSKEEIEALQKLLTGNIYNSNTVDFIDEKIEKLTHEIIDEINKVYFLDFDQNDFYTRFSVHLSNLIERIKNGRFNHNPMLDVLKSKHLLIYDLGLFVAGIISKRMKIVVPDDEVAFLSLHFGIFLEQKIARETVSVGILVPSYNRLESKIIGNLEHYFKGQINIKEVVTQYNEMVNQLESDIVISTVPYEGTAQQEVISLSPLFNMSDLKKIENSINKIKNRKKINVFQELTQVYFSESRFNQEIVLDRKDDYISFLGEQLIEAKIITASYLDSVFAREEMSSTSFNTVAIPHSLLRTANKSCFSVLFNKKPILWDVYEVEMILFMVINAEDQEQFTEYLQLIIEIASEEDNVKKLIQQKDYLSFITNLNELIKNTIESEW